MYINSNPQQMQYQVTTQQVQPTQIVYEQPVQQVHTVQQVHHQPVIMQPSYQQPLIHQEHRQVIIRHKETANHCCHCVLFWFTGGTIAVAMNGVRFFSLFLRLLVFISRAFTSSSIYLFPLFVI
jgi:hypothetical protein